MLVFWKVAFAYVQVYNRCQIHHRHLWLFNWTPFRLVPKIAVETLLSLASRLSNRWLRVHQIGKEVIVDQVDLVFVIKLVTLVHVTTLVKVFVLQQIDFIFIW